MSEDGGGSRPPGGIEEEHWRPVQGWARHASPLSLVVFGVVVALGLTGFLGHERDWVAKAAPDVKLTVHGPEVIRSGEFLEIRVGVEAYRPLARLGVGIDESLWEDITINTVIPAPVDETSRDGEVRFTFADQPAGTFLLKIDAQINPDIVGGNAGAITVYEGDRPLASVDVNITVLP